MKKFLLTSVLFLSLVCGLYSAYLLFKDGIEPIIGAVLTSICVVVFVWCLSLLRKHRIKSINLFWVIIITLLLLGTTIAYAGVEPMSGAKDKVVKWLETENGETNEPDADTVTPATSPETAPKQIILKEYFLAGLHISPQVVELNKVKQWLYSSSQQLDFKSLNPPYVVNAAIRTVTSQVATDLEVRIYKKGDPLKVSDIPITTRTIPGMGGRQAFIIKEKGDYIIDVKSVGCGWWAMVGHESEAYRQ